MAMEERMLTVDEAAQRLGAHEQTVRRWLRSGKIRGHMPGGTKLGYRIAASEIARLLNHPDDAPPMLPEVTADSANPQNLDALKPKSGLNQIPDDPNG